MELRSPTGTVAHIIRERRTVLQFKQDAVSADLLEELLDVAVWAPNHHLQEPWRFVAFQDEGRQVLASAIYAGFPPERREKTDPEKITARILSVPMHLLIVMPIDPRPLVYEEDFAAGRTVLIAACAIIPLLLSACGSTATKSPSPAPASVETAAPATTPPDTKRTSTDASGKQVEVPANPQRVVALSETDLDAMLALGLKPVGTVSGRGQTLIPRYLGDRPAGIPIVGTVSQPTMDKVIELNPDLILAGSLADPQILAQLSAIAPTVNTSASGEAWKTVFQRIATTPNQESEVKQWFDRYDKKVTEVKAKLGPNASAQVSVVRWNPAGPIYMSKDLFTSQVLAEVGLKRVAMRDGQVIAGGVTTHRLGPGLGAQSVQYQG